MRKGCAHNTPSMIILHFRKFGKGFWGGFFKKYRFLYERLSNVQIGIYRGARGAKNGQRGFLQKAPQITDKVYLKKGIGFVFW